MWAFRSPLFCKKGKTHKIPIFTGEARWCPYFAYDRCFERQDIPHLSWLFLKMEFSSLYV
jgi:hypothetical protein